MNKPVLQWNTNDGFGFVKNLEKFRELHPTIRMDFLQDWIEELNEEYEYAKEQCLTLKNSSPSS